MERSMGGVRRKKSGFTLLELIIVLVVLAALAALVIPLLGWVRDQAKYATTAAAASELVNNLELYKAATGKYPDRMDSMIDTSGAVYTMSYPATAVDLVATSTSQDYRLYNGAGITSIMRHTPATATTTDPSSSSDGVAPTPLSDATTNTVLTINPGIATSSPYYAKWKRIVQAAYPNQSTTAPTLPSGRTLVVFGVGSRTSTAGSTMTGAPLSQVGLDANQYARYYAVFEVSSGPTGRGRVQLKMVLDPQFEVVAKNLTNFKGSGPTDDAGAVATTPAGT